jgi:hypothetical protein
MQRATIVVHDGKILVKTEIVKAIITADKAVLIKGRWGQGGVHMPMRFLYTSFKPNHQCTGHTASRWSVAGLTRRCLSRAGSG